MCKIRQSFYILHIRSEFLIKWSKYTSSSSISLFFRFCSSFRFIYRLLPSYCFFLSFDSHFFSFLLLRHPDVNAELLSLSRFAHTSAEEVSFYFSSFYAIKLFLWHISISSRSLWFRNSKQLNDPIIFPVVHYQRSAACHNLHCFTSYNNQSHLHHKLQHKSCSNEQVQVIANATSCRVQHTFAFTSFGLRSWSSSLWWTAPAIRERERFPVWLFARFFLGLVFVI